MAGNAIDFVFCYLYLKVKAMIKDFLMEASVKNNHVLFRELPSFLTTHTVDHSEVEKGLWSALRNGERVALDAIFDRYAKVLYAFGRNFSKDGALLEDCIQDVFFELWVRRSALAPQVKHLKSYLMKSLRRRIARRMEVENRFVHKDIQPEDGGVDFSMETVLIREQVSSEKKELLSEALKKLSKRQQEAIYLKFFENISYDQMAAIMEIDQKAAYNLISKSILVLRQELKEVHNL